MFPALWMGKVGLRRNVLNRSLLCIETFVRPYLGSPGAGRLIVVHAYYPWSLLKYEQHLAWNKMGEFLPKRHRQNVMHSAESPTLKLPQNPKKWRLVSKVCFLGWLSVTRTLPQQMVNCHSQPLTMARSQPITVFLDGSTCRNPSRCPWMARRHSQLPQSGSHMWQFEVLSTRFPTAYPK